MTALIQKNLDFPFIENPVIQSPISAWSHPLPLDIPEILEIIFSYLDEQTLVNVVLLVSRKWFHMNHHKILRQVVWDYRVNDDEYLLKIPGAGRLFWRYNSSRSNHDDKRWSRLITMLSIAHWKHWARDQPKDERLYKLLQNFLDNTMWNRSPNTLLSSPLKELTLHGDIDGSLEIRKLLSWNQSLSILKIRTSQNKIICIGDILNNCRGLEILHLEAVERDNIIQLPGKWLPCSAVMNETKILSLHSLVLRKVVFVQSHLEDLLKKSPKMGILHLLHLVNGDDDCEDGLTTCRYDWWLLFRFMCSVPPLASNLRSIHFSLRTGPTFSESESINSYQVFKKLPSLREWVTWGLDLLNEKVHILNRPIFLGQNMVTSLQILWDIRWNFVSGPQGRSYDTQWWITTRAIHLFLCRSPNLLEFKMENAYYLLFHMDIHDRCTFQYSNQINARWCGDYGIDVSHETRKGIWGCRNLKTLELDMRCFGADKLEKSVQLRVLNGYIARVCPRLLSLSINIHPVNFHSSVQFWKELQMTLESGICLLARLGYLVRLHYRLDTTKCDIWDLNWMLASGYDEISKAKRLEKLTQWDTWRKEELEFDINKRRQGTRSKLINRVDMNQYSKEVRKQMKNLGMILDVIDMVEEMNEGVYRCLPSLSWLAIGGFEQPPAQEIERLFARSRHSFPHDANTNAC